MTSALTLTIGRKDYAVASTDEASRLYQELRDKSGLGASQWPTGKLSNGLTISYNGRVWNGETLAAEAAEYDREVRP